MLKKMMEQHVLHVELWDSCELPAWAVIDIKKEITRLEREEKNG